VRAAASADAGARTFQIKFAHNTAISPKRAGIKPNTLDDDHAIGLFTSGCARGLIESRGASVP